MFGLLLRVTQSLQIYLEQDTVTVTPFTIHLVNGTAAYTFNNRLNCNSQPKLSLWLLEGIRRNIYILNHS
jgi:hypothetical protein